MLAVFGGSRGDKFFRAGRSIAVLHVLGEAPQELAADLVRRGWSQIEEIPGSIDLSARAPSGDFRVIFEVKTISNANEVSQCRSALSQLLEYRFFFGD